MALTAQDMVNVWQRHTYAEFVDKNAEAALTTMTDDAHVLLIPSGQGGWGKPGVRRFYAESFIPNIPPDLAPELLSQTVGSDRIVEEAIYRFTHSLAMDWMIPGVAATNKPVEVGVVAIIEFRDGMIASEHLYWDQASVLAQLEVIPGSTPGVGGREGTRRLYEPGNE